MKKMDSFKCTIIKADEIVIKERAMPLSAAYDEESGGQSGKGSDGYDDYNISETEKLKRETERHIKTAKEENYKKGFADGIQHSKKEVNSSLEAAAVLIKKVSRVRDEILLNTEQQVVKLAFAIAEKVINQEVTTRRDIVLSVLKKALNNISETEGMKIRLNPHDFRYMMEMKKDFLQSFEGIRNVTFEEDTAVKRGGAVVETMFGEVDARLESQLREIKEAMLHQ